MKGDAKKYSPRNPCVRCRKVSGQKLILNLCQKCYRWCYRFSKRYGRRPTPEEMQPKRLNIQSICKNCKRCMVQGKGLCKTCWSYERKTGTPRPKHLWMRSEACKVCGKPQIRARGRCGACLVYKYRHGEDRTKEQVQKLYPLGFCDCGRPAKSIESVRVGAIIERFPLCDECGVEVSE
jgi:hypothetical protein